MLFVAPLAPVAVADATAETAPAPAPRDPTTGQLLPQTDATGQPLSRRDATGQPLVQKDETGQVLPTPEDEETPIQRPDSLIRQLNGAFGAEERERLRDALVGGHDWRAQFAVVEGYNTNVFQTQNVLNGPGIPHPSAFTGADAGIEWLTWTSPHDQQTFRFQVRGQHYEPLNGDQISDDGSLIGSFSGQFMLSQRTYVIGSVMGTVTSSNSAQVSDGPLFLVDPTSLQRTYTLESARVGIVHELSPRWRVRAGADVELSTTLHDLPIRIDATHEIDHHGLDYVSPGVDLGVFHDFGEADVGTALVRYEPTYIAFLINPSATPPAYNGYTTVEVGEATVGWIHGFSERLRSWATAGLTIASAPPLGTDTRPIESPVFGEELSYSSKEWLTVLGLSYSYGSPNPRLGFGPGVGATFTMQGRPYPHGDWRKLSVLGTLSAGRSVFLETDTTLSRLTYLGDSFEIRYGVNKWLGILGGYSGRWVVFEGASSYPSLLRHVVFLGLSGYFSSDQSLPTIDTFSSPITPPS
jgi:hypothetical protein